jgi:hypothetical protein
LDDKLEQISIGTTEQRDVTQVNRVLHEAVGVANRAMPISADRPERDDNGAIQ